MDTRICDRRKAAATAGRPWTDLLPELLTDVCSRLHDAVDYVRFHAICKPWHDAAPETRRQAFLPWLITPCNGRIMHSPVISSAPNLHRRRSTVLKRPCPSSTVGETNWVGSADGRSAWLFLGGPKPTLLDLVTGDLTCLPPFPADDEEDATEWPMDSPRGIVYGDGTVFIYSFDSWSLFGQYVRVNKGAFKAAILRPGDKAWTVVETILACPPVYHSCAAYHGGKVLVWVGKHFWCVATPDFRANGSITTEDCLLNTTGDRLESEYFWRDHSYVLESNGELLWASILVGRGRRDALAVRVHALEEEEEAGSNKMRWVERDHRSLRDRVMFLGSPASFAMDANEIGLDGGCAYFVFKDHLVRYNFADGETKPMESMFPVRSLDTRLWLQPKPKLGPTLKIQDSKQEVPGIFSLAPWVKPEVKEEEAVEEEDEEEQATTYKWFSHGGGGKE